MSADTTPANVQAHPGLSVNMQSSDDVTFGSSSGIEPTEHRYIEDRVEQLESAMEALDEFLDHFVSTANENAALDDKAKEGIARTFSVHRAQLNRLLKAHNSLRRTFNRNVQIDNRNNMRRDRREVRAAFFRARDAAWLRKSHAADYPFSEAGSAIDLAYMYRQARHARHGQLP